MTYERNSLMTKFSRVWIVLHNVSDSVVSCHLYVLHPVTRTFWEGHPSEYDSSSNMPNHKDFLCSQALLACYSICKTLASIIPYEPFIQSSLLFQVCGELQQCNIIKISFSWINCVEYLIFKWLTMTHLPWASFTNDQFLMSLNSPIETSDVHR